jgi:hypothetical protein
MTKSSTTPSIWWMESSNSVALPNPYATYDKQTFLSDYPTYSVYHADVLINEHLKQHWNTCWTKIVAVNQLIIGLSIFIIGLLMIFFQLTLSLICQGVWTGGFVILAGLMAFFTIIHRRHRYFLLVASIHLLVGLLSTIMIFISVFVIAIEFNHSTDVIIRNEDRQLTYALHIALIILGLYEKLLCYTFLIMIVRHTHKMV